jgi:tetratricopeptide (TPR) repeat protein
MRHFLIFIEALIVSALFYHSAYAEVKIIEADSTYIIGDNDSKVDARRIATQEAKRKALELAGTYVESMSVVKDYQLTKDEVKSYSAGVLETEVVSEQMRGTTEHPEIYIKARCKIDSDALTAHIDRYRESEDLKEQLDASSKENDDLKQERDALIKQLAAEKDKAKAAETRKQLDTVLSKEEANDDTKKVWINIGPQLVEVDESGHEINQADLDKNAVILQRVVQTNPQNERAQYMLTSIYLKEGNYSEAEKRLRIAIQQHPRNPEPHLKLGVVLKDQHRYQEALQEFHVVERLRPRNPMMLFYTGVTFKAVNECRKSVHYLQRFVNEVRSKKFPKKRERAIQVIDECGGKRPGRTRRSRQS